MSLSINKPTIPVYNFTLVENISENKNDKDLVEEILIQLLPNKNDEENSSFSKTDFKYLTKLVLYLLDNFSNNVELAVGMFSLKYNINMRLIIANFVDIVNNSNVQSEAKDFIFDKNDDSKINIIRKFIFYFQLLKAKKYPKSKIDSLIATSFPGDISMFKYDAIIDVFFNNPLRVFIKGKHKWNSYSCIFQPSIIVFFRFNLVAKCIVLTRFMVDLL